MTCNLPNSNGRCPNNNKDACPWRINLAKYNNCFWTYIKANTLEDGSMREHSQTEVAKILGLSSPVGLQAIKDAEAKFEELLKEFNLRAWYTDDKLPVKPETSQT